MKYTNRSKTQRNKRIVQLRDMVSFVWWFSALILSASSRKTLANKKPGAFSTWPVGMIFYVRLIVGWSRNGSGGNSVRDRQSRRRKCIDFLQFLVISVILSEVGLHLRICSLGQFHVFSMYHKLMGKWGGKIRRKLDLLAGMQYSLGSWNSSLIRRKKWRNLNLFCGYLVCFVCWRWQLVLR